MESLIHLICMPLWFIACPILGFFYNQKKTGSAVHVNVNGEQKYGIYQADGTIQVSFWQEVGTTIYKSLIRMGPHSEFKPPMGPYKNEMSLGCDQLNCAAPTGSGTRAGLGRVHITETPLTCASASLAHFDLKLVTFRSNSALALALVMSVRSG